MPDSPARPSWFARVRRLLALRRDPARIGDAAVLQSDLLGARMSPQVRARVEQLHARDGMARLRLRVDHEALRRLPRGSFGREFAEFCTANHIVPATISDDFDDETLRRTAAIARYISTHDMFHVLLGCDTSIPGELRITAFIMAQRYFRGSAFYLALLHVLAPLARPHQMIAIFNNVRRGRELAARAPLLLAEPIEDWFSEDLRSLQQRLGLAEVTP